MQHFLEKSLRRGRHHLRRNLFLGRLAGRKECDARWPDRTMPQDSPFAEANRPEAVLGEAVTLLAASALIYLLIAILVGLLTRSP